MAALSAAGVFGPGACDRRKALVCATEDGRAAICRQLSPAAHLDTSRKARGRLAPCPPPASRPAWPLRHRHPPPPTRARQVASYLAPHVPSVVLLGADPPGGASSSAPPSARRAETRRPARASLWHPAVVRCRWRAAAAWSTTWPRGRRVAREAPRGRAAGRGGPRASRLAPGGRFSPADELCRRRRPSPPSVAAVAGGTQNGSDLQAAAASGAANVAPEMRKEQELFLSVERSDYSQSRTCAYTN